MKKGLIQVYCGNGKGKTTAAIGQGIRAIGQGFKVIMIQFLKGQECGELNTIQRLEPDFKVFRFDKPEKFFNQMNEAEKEDLKRNIQNGINFARKVMDTRECDILILDEVLGVIENDLIDVEEIDKLLVTKPNQIEVILTGRNLKNELTKRVDYISKIEEIKHPYSNGIKARKGIEF